MRARPVIDSAKFCILDVRKKARSGQNSHHDASDRTRIEKRHYEAPRLPCTRGSCAAQKIALPLKSRERDAGSGERASDL